MKLTTGTSVPFEYEKELKIKYALKSIFSIPIALFLLLSLFSAPISAVMFYVTLFHNVLFENSRFDAELLGSGIVLGLSLTSFLLFEWILRIGDRVEVLTRERLMKK